MAAKWYYLEDGASVGPASAEEIADRIKEAKSQSFYVWREGLPEWIDARSAAEFSAGFLAAETDPVAEGPAETNGLSAAKRATLAQRAWHELVEYLAISAYLCVCFSALIFYKTTILPTREIGFAPISLAVVKALILGKFILVLQSFRIGERGKRNNIVFAGILQKSLLFTVLLIALTVIEEVIVGHIHGRTSQESLSEIAGGALPQAFAVGVLIFLILIPYFTYREVAARLGEGELRKLLLARRWPENEK